MIRFSLNSLFLITTFAVVAMSVIYRWWPFVEVRKAVLYLLEEYLLIAFIAAFAWQTYRMYRGAR